MPARDPSMMPHDVSAIRVGQGWVGRYTLPGRTCHVRGEDGLVRVFETRSGAERAAFRAMLRSLNTPAGKVEGKSMRVVRNTRWARAEAMFAGAR